ncbi:MAG: hypothetical protein LC104_10110, partial [Bacteroidales bacterium]|nr:hypothetical protein [Bacteroidales bacterium]
MKTKTKHNKSSASYVEGKKSQREEVEGNPTGKSADISTISVILDFLQGSRIDFPSESQHGCASCTWVENCGVTDSHILQSAKSDTSSNSWKWSV